MSVVNSVLGVHPALPGRTRIAPHALSTLAAAITADVFEVKAGDIRVELSDDAGALSFAIHTPIRLTSLDRVSNDPGVVGRTGGTVLDRAVRGQTSILNRLTELTGSRITRVSVRVTGAHIRQERRVV
ncbi:MAG TPA: hypothetical protein VGP24_08660 [Glaciihabitans sp.]|nr:hypothetical protein [Glaciihabitans sp.]